jgi:hypothetical protein
MGPITSTTYSPDTSGSRNHVWIINGAKLNISFIFDQNVERAIQRFQNIAIANNPGIIINIMLVSTVLILPILFLYLKHHYQYLSSKINGNWHTHIISTESPTSNITTLSKNVPSYSGGYLV